MKLTRQEREDNRKAFREMSPRDRGDYLLTYYKLPLVLLLTVILVVGSFVHKAVTKKTPVLYVGLVNVTVGSGLESSLTTEFLHTLGESHRKSSVELYKGLVLTDDPSSEAYQYVYASRMKVLAAMESREFDVVLMNQEAYDTFSQSGYLAALEPLLGDGDALVPFLTKNLVIYEDNAEEHAMDESVPYEAVTGEEVNAVECSGFPLFHEAGMEGPLYLGLIANSPRVENAVDYLRFLCAAHAEFPVS
jgi:hypothetical protein